MNTAESSSKLVRFSGRELTQTILQRSLEKTLTVTVRIERSPRRKVRTLVTVTLMTKLPDHSTHLTLKSSKTPCLNLLTLGALTSMTWSTKSSLMFSTERCNTLASMIAQPMTCSHEKASSRSKRTQSKSRTAYTVT